MARASDKAVMSFHERLKHARELLEEGHSLVRRTHRNLDVGNAHVARSVKLLAETRQLLMTARH
jgi:hypothetical protein